MRPYIGLFFISVQVRPISNSSLQSGISALKSKNGQYPLRSKSKKKMW
jgi:hypothetical protein